MKYRANLARLIQLLVNNADDAADLLQDLALVVLRHPTGPRDATCFKAWCRVLARNIAVNHRRATTRRTLHVRVVNLDVVDCEAPMANPELLSVLHDALAHVSELDAPSLELLERRYMLGETASEIASTLRTSPASVRMRLKRLRSSLRDDFEKREGGALRQKTSPQG